MDKPRPVQGRHIFLADHTGGMFIWSCSHCYWTTPFMHPDRSPANPVEAVKKFTVHRCEEYPTKEAVA
jgi:hypothetical protein